MPALGNRFALSMCIAISLLTAPGCDDGVGHLKAPVEPLGKITLGAIRHGVEGTTLKGERYEVELEQFYRVIADIEVHACPQHIETSGLLISTAYAHVPESATRLGTPTLEDLLGPIKKARVQGEVAPPMGRYCALRLIVAPADDDTINLSELSQDELLGHSFIVKGRWRARGDGPWQDFEFASRETLTWTITLDEPIALSAEQSSAFILIDKALEHSQADALGDWITASTPHGQDIGLKMLELVASTQRRYKSTR